MPRRSNKSIIEVLTPPPINVQLLDQNGNEELERKITLATEGFTTHKFCELVLKDRTRLSKENALTICEYIIAMKREVNPRLSYKKYTIEFLAELSKAVGIEKKFIDMTRDDVLYYLDSCRKPENEDPLHKWIGSYNTKLVVLSRFFKWLHYPDIEDPKRRSELSAVERKPDCIMGIKRLKRKEISCYKPSDLWTQEDDLLFLMEKFCINKVHHHWYLVVACLEEVKWDHHLEDSSGGCGRGFGNHGSGMMMGQSLHMGAMGSPLPRW